MNVSHINSKGEIIAINVPTHADRVQVEKSCKQVQSINCSKRYMLTIIRILNIEIRYKKELSKAIYLEKQGVNGALDCNFNLSELNIADICDKYALDRKTTNAIHNRILKSTYKKLKGL